MRLRLSLSVFSVICLAASCSCVQEPVVQEIANKTAGQTKVAELTEEQAIAFAEKFIAQNGYTDVAPDKDNLSFESIEWESKIDKMLKSRHDTLERKAFGVSQGRKGGGTGWTVVFKFKKRSYPQTRKNGRAVTMNLNGSDGCVEHVDFILAKIDKKL